MHIKHVIDLPVPPTLNRLWRRAGERFHKDPCYTAWHQDADAHAMAQRLKVVTIPGDFTAEIALDRARTRADLDNVGTKALFDWAQSRELIRNDKNCVGYSVKWVSKVDAPAGCRMTICAHEKK